MLIGGLRSGVVSELGLQGDILEASTAAELLIEDFAELVLYTSAHAPTEAVLCFEGRPSRPSANLLFRGDPDLPGVRTRVCVCLCMCVLLVTSVRFWGCGDSVSRV